MIPLLFVVQAIPSAPQEPARQERGPVAERTIRGRLLDALSGAPVAGATCELWSEDFDAPMELVGSVESALDGSFALEDPRRGGEKVRVRAEGYRSTVFAGEDEVFLFPRDEPFVLRVLDLDGSPIAGARVRSHQTCQHGPPAVEGMTDAEGRVVFADAPPFEDGPEYEVRASGYGALTQLDWSTFGIDSVAYLPRRAEVRLRLLDADGTPLARRRFRQQGPGHIAFVTDDDGRAVLDSLYESREIGLEESVKEGALHLFGRPSLEGECTLRIGSEFRADAPPPDWPLLSIRAARGSTVNVQFGTDSITCEGKELGATVRVRPVERVIVLTQGAEVHRIVLEPWSGERTVDLTDPANRIEPLPSPEDVALRFTVRADNGEVPDASATLRWPGPQREDEDPSPGGVLFHVPRGERWEVGFEAEGHVPQYRQGRAQGDAASPEQIVLSRSARVEFRGKVERIELAGQVRTSADGEGWRELELAPGVALGHVWTSIGSQPREAVLGLKPGERRVLDTEVKPLPPH